MMSFRAGYKRLQRVMSASLVAVLAVFCLSGCKERAVKRVVSDEGGQPLNMYPNQAEYVLAKVGDKNITLGDYAATLERMDRFDRLRYKTPERRRELLDEIITVELLAQEAERRGLDKDPQAQQAVREVLRDAIMRDARKDVTEPSAFSEQQVRAYYDAHMHEYQEPERRRLSSIIVTDQKKAEELLKKAQGITDQEVWGKLVLEHSEQYKSEKYEGPVETAGDLGLVGPPGDERSSNPRVDEAMREAAFGVEKAGQMVPKVLSGADGKFYVVRVDVINPGHSRSFADAERTIRIMLTQQQIAEREAQFEQELRKKYPISIDEKALSEAKIINLDKMPEKLPPLPGKTPPRLPERSGHGHDDHEH